MPGYQFETQDGRLVRFDDYRGKVVLLSFIYTRCPDVTICPAISGKFAYMQHHLDPKRFHLITMTLDPLHDSPAVMQAYADRFGAEAQRWSLLTGEPAEIKAMLDGFSLNPLETNPGLILHGDTLAILDKDGKIADLIPTAGWAPDDVIASARNVDGLTSNPLRRFELATIAGVLAFCGGSILTGAIVLDSVVVLAGFLILGWILYWVTKNIIIKERF
jgi:protein SCO1/2